MPRGIELKLGLSPETADAVRSHPLLQGGVQTQLVSTYYDTTKLTLYRRGIALRIRETGAGSVQTIKGAGTGAGGLFSRLEWEQDWTGSFDFSRVDDPRTARRLRAATPHLEPAFVTEFTRTTYRVRQGESVILAMLDQGVIRAQCATAPLCELELELEIGAAADLFQLALALAETLPLWPEDRSKAERGYQLWKGSKCPPRDLPASLSAEAPAGTAFRQLVAGQLRAWQEQVRRAPAHPVESVHQVRVTLRRIRALLHIFAPLLPAAFADTWRRRLGDCARELGAARELDVLCDELLAPLLADAESATRLPVLQALEAERRAARAQAEAALARERQGRLMLEFAAAIGQQPEANPDTDLVSLAGARMAWLRRRLRKRARAVPTADPEPWHALRIAAKQLRYGLDFFTPLWPRKAVTGYRRHLARIQKNLGRLQDLAVAHRVLRHHVDTCPQCSELQRQLEHHYDKRAAKWRRNAVRETHKLLAQAPPWRIHS